MATATAQNYFVLLQKAPAVSELALINLAQQVIF